MQSLLQRLLLGNAGGGGGGNPTLNYNFVDGSAFPSAITFSRGTNATQFDSSGNLVYAPVNLLLQSEAFNTTWTTSNASITANSTTAPSATTTADTLVEDTATNFHYVQQTVSGTTNTNNYTLSCFIKASTRTAARIAIIEGTTFSRQVRATVDLSAGTVVGAALNSATLTAATIQAVGNSWYRVTVAGVLGGTDTNILCAVYVGQDPATFNYAGNGTSGVFIWGAQLNPTPVLGGITESLSTYYPTTASAYYGPRLDYDPATLAAQGLLIEEQRTNFFTNTATATGATIGTGSVSGPDNVACRTLIPTAGAASFPRIDGPNQSFSISSGQTIDWALSGWLAVGPVGSITLEPRLVFQASVGGLSSFTYAELQINTSNWTVRTKTLSSGLSEVSAPTITLFKTGLYRITWVIRYTQDATGRNIVAASIQARDTTGSGTYTADGVSGVQYALLQAETGSFVTSTIPTTTTALTRNADVASVNTLSPWFNATEGTIYLDFAGRQAGAQPYLTMLSNTGETERIYQRYVGGQYQTFARVAGVDIASVYNSSEGSAVNAKIASAYNASQLATSTNGQAVTGLAVASLSNVPSGLNKLWLGSFTGTSSFANGYLRRLTYYPVRLTNAALQQITT